MRLSSLCTLVLLALGSCGVPSYYDIGVVHRRVTTPSRQAQLWFDRGLALTFGFNHEEAIRCFDRAVAADPNCAMAHWGKAYALGPNYNNTEMSPEAAVAAFDALQRAMATKAGCSAAEQDLIQALSHRYASPPPTERRPLEEAYAKAMEGVLAGHPDDPDVASLTAEALMLLEPWKLWTPDGKPAQTTPRIRAVLEPALARWPDHPGLCHHYIHTMEAGPEVRKATRAAETLEHLVPGVGHLVHMPSHIYIWTGRFQDAVRVNQLAVQKDLAYAEFAGRENFYTLYRIHNYHFIAYAAMFTGNFATAIEAAREIPRQIPASMLEGFADFVEVFVATPMHVLVRFGRWQEILDEPDPGEALPAAQAVWRYARGLAFAALGRVDEALAEQQRFRRARERVPATRMLFNNPVAQILGVADAVLQGEILYRDGKLDAAFAQLRAAVRLDEQLNYDEPWGWMEPARHALGALLTEQQRHREAIEVYQQNLARFPDNGWALHGLAECLTRTGNSADAAKVRARFEAAWRHADTVIPGSCFCRTIR